MLSSSRLCMLSVVAGGMFTHLILLGFAIDYRATYIYGIGNRVISRDTPLNTWPQYIDMG